MEQRDEDQGNEANRPHREAPSCTALYRAPGRFRGAAADRWRRSNRSQRGAAAGGGGLLPEAALKNCA